MQLYCGADPDQTPGTRCPQCARCWYVSRFEAALFNIPLEWSRMESGSLSPWKHIRTLFYAHFFSGWTPEIYFKTIVALWRVQGHPPYEALSLDPLDFILNHLNHDSGFYSGSLWQCFLLAFLRILANKESKDTKVKKSRNQANGATTNLSLEFDQLWIFWPSPSLPRDRKVWHVITGWCGHLSCWCL